jgi:hypothetical protein
MRHRSFQSLSVGLAALVIAGCSHLRPFRVGLPEPKPTPAAGDGSRDPAPKVPLALSDEEDFVVRIVAGNVKCSGTLIDDDRVLTAHHCVAERDDHGDIQASNVRASDIRVELGGDYLPWGEVGVRSVVAPPCGYKAGDGDIAILVLERRLIGVATLTPRLDREPVKGEALEPLGFGRCATSHGGVRRRERSGGQVDALGSARFRMSASICPGDSGGPALSRETQELVGVISSSVMDGNERTRGLSEFTRVDRWRPVFALAEQISQGASPAELPPIDCSTPE